MKIVKKNKNIKKIVIVIISVIICMLLVGSAAIYIHNRSNTGDLDKGNNKMPTSSDSSKPSNNSPTNQNNTTEPSKIDNPKSDASKPVVNQQATITITALNQNNSILQIRTLISILSDTGTCKLTLTKESTIVTRSSGTQATANSSTCKGFDIPISELSAGQWGIKIDFSSQSVSASVSTNKTIE